AAIHEARKCCKKVRALLRLLRPELGPLYRRENTTFRDLARRLAPVRDADALHEALAALELPPGSASANAERAAAAHVLTARREALLRDAGGCTQLAREAAAALTAARARAATWSVRRDDLRAVLPGFRRTYRRARRALERAAREPGVERLHEWRRRAKTHWYQLRLLAGAADPVLEGRVPQLEELSRILGEDHDLALLDEALARAGPASPSAGIAAAIAAERLALEQTAFALGREVFTERPKKAAARLRAALERWLAAP
ncbi:MAG: CHAD domain-containing protein, partial [Planctomycetes bacterium]|nr:CHAD domain-containing protein [Planctomycetota bacterium]